MDPLDYHSNYGPPPSVSQTCPNRSETPSVHSSINTSQLTSGLSTAMPVGLSTSLTGLYSCSGFDIIQFLERVVNRKNPVVHLGPVDFSCSFLISDALAPDCPLVYVSETFEKTTGYTKEEVLGMNCRFLQSPDGNVKPGSVRKFSDNNVISHMKACIDERHECQFSLVNYRKSKEPFINLVTIIPISYNDDGQITHFIGFQIDLIDQPDAILQRMRDGTYYVNYQRKVPVGHSIQVPEENSLLRTEVDKLMTPELVSTQHNCPIPVFQSKFIDNCGDFVHILSIRGLLLYASPKSCKEILEFEAEELLGHNISEFVHPADLVFVMRELRSATPNDTINIVCRFRKKSHGYVYLELRGHVYHGESGKRTRCIVMSGREKGVGRILAGDVLVPELEQPESWSKISPEGLFLYNDPSIIEILGLEPDQVFARSLFEFVSPNDRDRLRQALVQTSSGARFVDLFNLSIRTSKGEIKVYIRFYNDGTSSPRHLFCQMKLVMDTTGALHPVDMHTMANYSNLYRDGNIFDFLQNDDASSLYFEINQLRVQNKRLREELESQVTGLSPIREKSSRDRGERSGSSTSSDSQRTANDGVMDEGDSGSKSKNQRVPVYFREDSL